MSRGFDLGFSLSLRVRLGRYIKLHGTVSDAIQVDGSITVISQDRAARGRRAKRRNLEGEPHMKSIVQKHSALSGLLRTLGAAIRL